MNWESSTVGFCVLCIAALFRDFDTRPDSTFQRHNSILVFLRCAFPLTFIHGLILGFIQQVKKDARRKSSNCKMQIAAETEVAKAKARVSESKSLRGKSDLIFRHNCDVCLHRTHQ